MGKRRGSVEKKGSAENRHRQENFEQMFPAKGGVFLDQQTKDTVYASVPCGSNSYLLEKVHTIKPNKDKPYKQLIAFIEAMLVIGQFKDFFDCDDKLTKVFFNVAYDNDRDDKKNQNTKVSLVAFLMLFDCLFVVYME